MYIIILILQLSVSLSVRPCPSVRDREVNGRFHYLSAIKLLFCFCRVIIQFLQGLYYIHLAWWINLAYIPNLYSTMHVLVGVGKII